MNPKKKMDDKKLKRIEELKERAKKMAQGLDFNSSNNNLDSSFNFKSSQEENSAN